MFHLFKINEELERQKRWTEMRIRIKEEKRTAWGLRADILYGTPFDPGCIYELNLTEEFNDEKTPHSCTLMAGKGLE